MSQLVYLAGGPDPDGFVALAHTPKGRLFRKQILKMNESFVHPANPTKKIKVDKTLAEALKRNFKSKMCDIVQVPVVNDANQHVEDPLRNAGQVVDVDYDDQGVYATIDARKYQDDFGKTLIGASALMHMDYTDTKTGDHVGPTLLHVAVTNRPHITDLSDYQEIVAASADSLSETPEVLSPAPAEEDKMELDEMIAALKSDHDIDVIALQEAASKDKSAELVSALSGVLAEAGVVALSAKEPEELGTKDLAEAIIELSTEKVDLENKVNSLVADAEALRLSAAEQEIDALIESGRILPKAKDAMVKLSMNDRETFEALVPEDSIVALSAMGVTTHDERSSEKFADEVARLSKIANGESE